MTFDAQKEIAEFSEWLYDECVEAEQALARGMIYTQAGFVNERQAENQLIWLSRALTFVNQLRIRLECETGSALDALGHLPDEEGEGGS